MAASSPPTRQVRRWAMSPPSPLVGCRVALKAGNGKFVAADNERTVLKNLGSAKPGIAESFQWVNLLRGDTMLMALTNHRYLATTPNTPGPVTVTALGASPARRSGAEFKWKTVE